MPAFNVVRFRVKPGREQEFLDAHKGVAGDWPGLRHANIIKTGEQTYCIIAEWTDMGALAAARPHMVATLDSFRDSLEDLGGGLGVTDPVSGPVVLPLKERTPQADRRRRAGRRAALQRGRCRRAGSGVPPAGPSRSAGAAP